MEEMLNKYERYLKAEQKSATTINTYLKCTKQMMDFVGKNPAEITSADLLDWQTDMVGKASATICQAISSVRHFFHWLVLRGDIENNPADKLELPTVHNKEKEYMSAQQVRAMINKTTNKRDRAILLLFANTGLRVSELCGITLKQWQEDSDTIKILGKGSKERFVYIGEEVKTAINSYLTTERRDNGTGLLFTSHGGEAIKTSNLSMTVKKYARMAGVPHWENITNHSLRAAFATIQSEAGTPIAEIRDMLGHSSVATSSRYIKTNREVLRNRMTTSLV